MIIYSVVIIIYVKNSSYSQVTFACQLLESRFCLLMGIFVKEQNARSITAKFWQLNTLFFTIKKKIIILLIKLKKQQFYFYSFIKCFKVQMEKIISRLITKHIITRPPTGLFIDLKLLLVISTILDYSKLR